MLQQHFLEVDSVRWAHMTYVSEALDEPYAMKWKQIRLSQNNLLTMHYVEDNVRAWGLFWHNDWGVAFVDSAKR